METHLHDIQQIVELSIHCALVLTLNSWAIHLLQIVYWQWRHSWPWRLHVLVKIMNYKVSGHIEGCRKTRKCTAVSWSEAMEWMVTIVTFHLQRKEIRGKIKCPKEATYEDYVETKGIADINALSLYKQGKAGLCDSKWTKEVNAGRWGQSGEKGV